MKSQPSNIDGDKAEPEAVEGAFSGSVDYASLVKIYGESFCQMGRHSLLACPSIRKVKVEGRPKM